MAMFFAVFDRIAPAQNKYMATVFNGTTTRIVVVNRVLRFNWQVTGVVGVLLEQECRGITARTVGTTITPKCEDLNDTITSGIVCDTGSTVVTEGGHGLIRRCFASSEEMIVSGAVTLTYAPAYLSGAQVLYARQGRSSVGLRLRANQGITIKSLTASTVGTVSYVIEFDDLPLV